MVNEVVYSFIYTLETLIIIIIIVCQHMQPETTLLLHINYS